MIETELDSKRNLSCSRYSSEHSHELLSCDGRRCRILSRNETVVHDSMRLPVGKFLKDSSQPGQLILDQKGDNMGELHLLFLAIGKTGHALSFYQRCAFIHHMTKHAWRMTDESDRLAGIVERLE